MVGVDVGKNELVVGIVGKCVFWSSCYYAHVARRLYQNVYLGQETGELGQRFYLLGWRKQRGADDYWSSSV